MLVYTNQHAFINQPFDLRKVHLRSPTFAEMTIALRSRRGRNEHPPSGRQRATASIERAALLAGLDHHDSGRPPDDDAVAGHGSSRRPRLTRRELRHDQGESCVRRVTDGPRKEAYLRHLDTADDAVLRVSRSDKLHNARAIVTDLRDVGPLLWDRFSGPREDQVWYYRSLAATFTKRAPGPHAEELAETVRRMAEFE